LRRQLQIVFQDPFLQPLAAPLGGADRRGGAVVHRIGGSAEERRALTTRLLREVGLDPEAADRYPHEFSGGQRPAHRHRRALVLKPRFIVSTSRPRR